MINLENVEHSMTNIIKENYKDIVVIADVCLCEYTSHGHCGLVKDGVILNDETLPLLARAAVSYAGAGADIVAPSDMMDGRVNCIVPVASLNFINEYERSVPFLFSMQTFVWCVPKSRPTVIIIVLSRG